MPSPPDPSPLDPSQPDPAESDRPSNSPTRPGPARDAALHVLLTFAAGIVVVIVAVNTSGGVHDAFVIAGPAVVAVGTIAAMIRTVFAWRANHGWQVWQGASWFLLALTVTWVFGAVPALVG